MVYNSSMSEITIQDLATKIDDLAGSMVTQSEFKGLVSKVDALAENMATKGDLEKLKEHVGEVRVDVADLKIEVADLKVEVADLKVEVADLRQFTEVSFAEVKRDIDNVWRLVKLQNNLFVRKDVLLEAFVSIATSANPTVDESEDEEQSSVA